MPNFHKGFDEADRGKDERRSAFRKAVHEAVYLPGFLVNKRNRPPRR